MKKLMTILLAAALALSLFGAGAAFAQESSPFAGSWKIYSMEGDMPVPHEQIAGTFMDSIAVTLGTDGRLSVNMFGEVVEDVWTDNGDGTGTEKFKTKAVPFERIRRITGYLVGDMTRWNNAKLAEEHDRVKHSLSV